MTRDEELLNEIIQRRGYIVVNGPLQMKVGALLGTPVGWNDTHRPLDTAAKWYVIGPSDRADMDEQTRLAMRLFPYLVPGPYYDPYFYRVLSD